MQRREKVASTEILHIIMPLMTKGLNAFRLCLVLCVALGIAGTSHGQKPIEVKVSEVDLDRQTLTVVFRDATRVLAIAPSLQVTVDDREAKAADIRPGDTATVLYDKASRAVIGVELWRQKAPEVRIQLLEDGGFERPSDRANLVNWERQAGQVASLSNPRSGSLALGLKVSGGDTEARVASVPRRAVKPGLTYRLSVWAKGKGDLRMNVYEYGATNPIKTEFFRTQPSLTLTDEWQQLRYEYKPQEKKLTEAAFALVLYGNGSEAVIDDAAFVFSESDNPDATLDDQPPSRELRIAVQTRNAEVELAVAGRRVPFVDGVATARVSEGLVSIALRASATGYRPAVRIRVVGQPETDNRWRVSGKEFVDWHAVGFDDRAWPIVQMDNKEFSWAPGGQARVAYFRQVVLWNESHYGPDRCVLPKVREWGFSKDGFDNLLLALYSPLPFELKDYEFVLDVPPAFESIGLDEKYYQRHVTNVRPSRVIKEQAEHDGERYTRYRVAFSERPVPCDATHYAWLPLRLRGGDPGASVRFFFHRRGNGNFTECEQSIPVRVLPPVNGRQPGKILINQYCPIYLSSLSSSHLRAMIRQSASAGFNFANLELTLPGWGPEWHAYKKSFYGELRANGFGTSIGSPGQFPLYGTRVQGHHSDALYRWAASTPEAQAQCYDGRRWVTDETARYCPTYVLEGGARRFREIVSEAYAELLSRTPDASVMFLDYEAHAWRDQKSGGEGSSTCFCPMCKKRFCEMFAIAGNGPLANQVIHDEYFKQWADFHAHQMAEVQKLLKQVANGLGLRYMVYSWAGFTPFWSNIRGKADIAFIGSPGNSAASGVLQKSIDEEGKFLRKDQAMPQVVGQRFSFLGVSESKGGWKEVSALSDDGFVQAMSWKGQILRVLAAFGGGIDLQNAGECVAGMPYWIGEATRIVAAYEDLFLDGERADDLASSDQLAYPDLLVLKKGRRRLVLLFNERDVDSRVTLRNLGLDEGQRARVFETSDWAPAESMEILVPAGDVVAIEVD